MKPSGRSDLRHGGVQPGEPPGGSAPLHGSDGPGRLPRQTATGRRPRPLPGYRTTGHRTGETRQVLPVHRTGSEGPVLYLLRVQQSVPGVLTSHQPAVPGHPHRGRKLPPNPLQQVCWEPGLLPEAALHPTHHQRSEPVHPAGPRHSAGLDLESGQQDLLLSDGLLPLQHDGDSLPVYGSLRGHSERRPSVVEASVGLCPEHPGDLPDPRQPPEDEPGGSHELHLLVDIQPSRTVFRCPVGHLDVGVHEGSVLKQTLRGPAGCPLPRMERSLCTRTQLSTTVPMMHQLFSRTVLDSLVLVLWFYLFRVQQEHKHGTTVLDRK